MIIPSVPRITAREVVEEALHPVRRNKMKARRKKLGLSQSELATVLDVDPASIYRHERNDVLPALWDYALKGIEAEAADPVARRILRQSKSHNLVVSSWKGSARAAPASRRCVYFARSATTSVLIGSRKKSSAPNGRSAKPSSSICRSGRSAFASLSRGRTFQAYQ